MKAETFALIKVGDKVTLTDQTSTLEDHGITIGDAGATVLIHKVAHGNGWVYYKSPTNGCEYALRTGDIVEVNKGKVSRFGPANIRLLKQTAGNTALRAELTVRMHAVRLHAQSALTSTPTDLFNEQVKLVEEQVRQAKMLHRAIETDPTPGKVEVKRRKRRWFRKPANVKSK